MTEQELLKAYKDTGLTPENIKAMYETVAEIGAPLWKIKQLSKADAEGRLVVLPCKVGDTVWRIVKDAQPHVTKDTVDDISLATDVCGVVITTFGGKMIPGDCFGKTVFLTREEAEKALAAIE